MDSGRLGWLEEAVVKDRSMPTSSIVSRIAAATSLASLGSRLPPGRATCEVQRSPRRAARLMNRISGVPRWTQGRLKKASIWEAKVAPSSVIEDEREGCDSGIGMSGYRGRIRIRHATEARFLQFGGFATSGHLLAWRSRSKWRRSGINRSEGAIGGADALDMMKCRDS